MIVRLCLINFVIYFNLVGALQLLLIIDKVGFRQRFQSTINNYQLSRNLNCLGNHLIPPTYLPTYLPTHHINFTLLLLSSLWSDLSM